MDRPKRTHAYSDFIADSTRWDHFKPRPGDIIVATPVKCGTTWTQMICALLVHQTPKLPQPLTVLSRWLDRVGESTVDVVAHFEAQQFRPVVKTHTPLDGLPYYDDATYVFCGRDPRDMLLSTMDHLANVSAQSMAEARKRGNLPDDFQLPTDPNALLPMWLTVGQQPWMGDGFPMGSIIYLSQTYWKFRRLPNMVFLHYNDLSNDLDGEMRRLSRALGIPVTEAIWPSLVEAARFSAMKEHADESAPGAHLGEWTSNRDFFRKARRGEWRDSLTAESKAFYEKITGERLEPELKAWLEGGRAAFDPAAS